MAAGEGWKSPGLVPMLAYDDVPRAVEWLSRVFGFRERSDARLSGHGQFLTFVDLDDVLVNLVSDGGHGIRSPRHVGSVSVGLKAYVTDVDAHYERAKSAGAVIVSAPQDGFWGGRIYRAKDLEGHLWEFSQGGRDLDASEWRLPPGLKRGV